jgi:hypothetical protein
MNRPRSAAVDSAVCPLNVTVLHTDDNAFVSQCLAHCRLSTYLSRVDHHSVVSGFAETLLSPLPADPNLSYQTPLGQVRGRGVTMRQELQDAARRSRIAKSAEMKEKDSSTDVINLVDRGTETG